MIRGLALRALRDLLVPTLLLGSGLLLAEGLLAWALPTYRRDVFGAILRLDVVRALVGALLGTELGPDAGRSIVRALPWVHPAVLALLWAHAIVGATRVPAGETDRGTIDVLLGLPVSRGTLWVAETLALIAATAGLLALGLGGYLAGHGAAGVALPAPLDLARVLTNLLALQVAVLGLAALASALCERRGRAVGAAFAVVLVSFLLNFLASLWEPARPFGFASLLWWYRPLDILAGTEWPLRDTAVLLGVGLTAWAAGGVVFARRDIHVL